MSRAVHEHPKKAAEPEQGRSRPVGSGWIAFAAIYLVITGMLNLIWGITALSKKSYFVEEGLVWSNLDVWGSFAIVVALCQLGVGALIYARKVAGMLMALVVAMAGIFVNFLSIGAYPVWSIIAIVGSSLVLWAVTVHSDEFI